MDVDKPTRVQLMVAWRDNRWVVARDSQELAAYGFRGAALEAARRVAGRIAQEGRDCYLLVLERDGRWRERPCPRPLPPLGQPSPLS
jgi:hypothetical protein